MATSIGTEGTLRQFFKQASHWVDNVKISWIKWRGSWVLAADSTGKPHPLMNTSGRVPVSVDAGAPYSGTPKIDSFAGTGTLTLGSAGGKVMLYHVDLLMGAAPANMWLETDADEPIGNPTSLEAAAEPEILVNFQVPLPGGTVLQLQGGTADEVVTCYWIQTDA